MAEKGNANIGFEKQIWDAACVLWEFDIKKLTFIIREIGSKYV